MDQVLAQCSAATSVSLLLLGQLARPASVAGVAVGVREGERLRRTHYLALGADTAAGSTAGGGGVGVGGGPEALQRRWEPLRRLLGLSAAGPRLVLFNLQARCACRRRGPGAVHAAPLLHLPCLDRECVYVCVCV